VKAKPNDKGKGGKGPGPADAQSGGGAPDRAASSCLRETSSEGRPCSVRLRAVFKDVRVDAALAGRLARGMPAHLYVSDEDGPREMARRAVHGDRRGGRGNRQVRSTLRATLEATGRPIAVLEGEDDSSSSDEECEGEGEGGYGHSLDLVVAGGSARDGGDWRRSKQRPGTVAGGVYAAALPIDLSGLLAPSIQHAVPAGHDARTETARAFGSLASFGRDGTGAGAGTGAGPVVGMALGCEPLFPEPRAEPYSSEAGAGGSSAPEGSESSPSVPLDQHPYFAGRQPLPGLEPRP